MGLMFAKMSLGKGDKKAGGRRRRRRSTHRKRTHRKRTHTTRRKPQAHGAEKAQIDAFSNLTI